MIVVKSAESPPAGFAEKLSKLLLQEGKSFSGTVPTPKVEEALESLMDQARMMVI